MAMSRAESRVFQRGEGRRLHRLVGRLTNAGPHDSLLEELWIENRHRIPHALRILYSLSGLIGDFGAVCLNLRYKTVNVRRVDCDRSSLIHVERQPVGFSNYLYNGKSERVAKRYLIEHVWIQVRQIGYSELGFFQVLEDLRRNHTGLPDLVRPNYLKAYLLQSRLDQGAHE